MFTYRELQHLLRTARVMSYVPATLKLNSKKVVLQQAWDSMTSTQQIYCIGNQAVQSTSNTLQPYNHVTPELPNIESPIPIDHSRNRVPEFNRAVNVRHIGIEFEFYCKKSIDDLTQYLVGLGYPVINEGYTHRVTPGQYKLVTDASLTMHCPNGYYAMELVTPPLNMNNARQMKQLKGILTAIREVGTKLNKACGTHVHLEAKDFSAKEIINYFKAWQANESTFDAQQPESRTLNNNAFCKSLVSYDFSGCTNLTQLCKKLGGGRLDIHGRYHKLNPYSFAKYGTLEVRHHSGTLNFTKIISYAKEQMQFMLDHRN